MLHVGSKPCNQSSGQQWLAVVASATLPVQAEPVLANLQRDHKIQAGRLVSVSAAPEKARRQADLATADLTSAKQLLSAVDTKHMQADAALRAVNEHLRQRQVRSC